MRAIVSGGAVWTLPARIGWLAATVAGLSARTRPLRDSHSVCAGAPHVVRARREPQPRTIMATQEERTPRDTDAEASGNRPLQDVSNAMVALYKELFGRGPTKVRSNYAGPDTLLCTLENTFTAAETTLQRMGEHSRLRDTRTFFQYAESDRFIKSVEEITGRRVRAFVSGIDSQA